MIRILEICPFSERFPLQPRVLMGDHIGIIGEELAIIAQVSKKGCHHSVSTSGMIHSSPQFYAFIKDEDIRLWINTGKLDTEGKSKHLKLLQKI